MNIEDKYQNIRLEIIEAIRGLLFENEVHIALQKEVECIVDNEHDIEEIVGIIVCIHLSNHLLTVSIRNKNKTVTKGIETLNFQSLYGLYKCLLYEKEDVDEVSQATYCNIIPKIIHLKAEILCNIHEKIISLSNKKAKNQLSLIDKLRIFVYCWPTKVEALDVKILYTGAKETDYVGICGKYPPLGNFEYELEYFPIYVLYKILKYFDDKKVSVGDKYQNIDFEAWVYEQNEAIGRYEVSDNSKQYSSLDVMESFYSKKEAVNYCIKELYFESDIELFIRDSEKEDLGIWYGRQTIVPKLIYAVTPNAIIKL